MIIRSSTRWKQDGLARNRDQVDTKQPDQSKDGFIRVRNGEAFLHNVHISPYEQGNILIMIRCARESYYYTKQIIRLENELKILESLLFL